MSSGKCEIEQSLPSLEILKIDREVLSRHREKTTALTDKGKRRRGGKKKAKNKAMVKNNNYEETKNTTTKNMV